MAVIKFIDHLETLGLPQNYPGSFQNYVRSLIEELLRYREHDAKHVLDQSVIGGLVRPEYKLFQRSGISRSKQNGYLHSMQNGTWRLGQGCCIQYGVIAPNLNKPETWYVNLDNGWNRLLAASQYDGKIRWSIKHVLYDTDIQCRDSVLAIDLTKRTKGDRAEIAHVDELLHINPGDPSASKYEGSIRLITSRRLDPNFPIAKADMGRPEIEQQVREHYAPFARMYLATVRFGDRDCPDLISFKGQYKNGALRPYIAMPFFAAGILAMCDNPQEAENMFAKTASGIGFKQDEPAKALREFFLSEHHYVTKFRRYDHSLGQQVPLWQDIKFGAAQQERLLTACFVAWENHVRGTKRFTIRNLADEVADLWTTNWVWKINQ